MGQHFTDQLVVTVRINEPTSAEPQRRAFAAKLRQLADMIEHDDALVLPGSGGANDDIGFGSFTITSLSDQEKPAPLDVDGIPMDQPNPRIAQMLRPKYMGPVRQG